MIPDISHAGAREYRCGVIGKVTLKTEEKTIKTGDITRPGKKKRLGRSHLGFGITQNPQGEWGFAVISPPRKKSRSQQENGLKEKKVRNQLKTRRRRAGKNTEAHKGSSTPGQDVKKETLGE